ncbi:hypothetical protein HMI54_008904 [Coelomomyces lativittatus]|nr:hypothetical protein HMI54_008904 [Coelomomyces lativittatus]
MLYPHIHIIHTHTNTHHFVSSFLLHLSSSPRSIFFFFFFLHLKKKRRHSIRVVRLSLHDLYLSIYLEKTFSLPSLGCTSHGLAWLIALLSCKIDLSSLILFLFIQRPSRSSENGLFFF